MSKKNIVLISLASLIIICTAITGFVGHPESNTDITTEKNFKSQYGIYQIPVPKKITFAGETMPLENFDTYESFERELLINTYWQSQTLILIKKANRYLPTIEKILEQQGVPPDFKYLAVAESGLTNVTSPSGAKGFWQFLKGTATDYKLEVNNEVDERYHLEKSTIAAAMFLKESYQKYGSWTMAAASYNMGRRNLSNIINRQKSNNYYNLVLGDETGRYVFRIAALKTIIENPQQYGFYINSSDLYQPFNVTEITVDTAITSIADFAYALGTNYKVLKELNPWLRDAVLKNTARKKYIIKIPANKKWRKAEPCNVFYPVDSIPSDTVIEE